MGRCGTDRLQLSVGETKELVVDYRRSGRRSPPTPNWMVWRQSGRRERKEAGLFLNFYFVVCLIPIHILIFVVCLIPIHFINLAAMTPEFP